MKFKITETEKRALCRQVPEFQEFVRQITLPELECDGDLFGGLVRSIVSQQLAIRAAEAILGRLEALTGELSAERILAADPGALRACGLSSRKVEYLRGIAEAAISGTIDFASLAALDDAAVIQELVKLKGVGVWTAEMLFKALDVCDDDRRMNAQRFEETFYSTKKEDAGKEQEKAANSAHESDQELLMKPEMAALLKALAKRL